MHSSGIIAGVLHILLHNLSLKKQVGTHPFLYSLLSCVTVIYLPTRTISRRAGHFDLKDTVMLKTPFSNNSLYFKTSHQ